VSALVKAASKTPGPKAGTSPRLAVLRVACIEMMKLDLIGDMMYRGGGLNYMKGYSITIQRLGRDFTQAGRVITEETRKKNHGERHAGARFRRRWYARRGLQKRKRKKDKRGGRVKRKHAKERTELQSPIEQRGAGVASCADNMAFLDTCCGSHRGETPEEEKKDPAPDGSPSLLSSRRPNDFADKRLDFFYACIRLGIRFAHTRGPGD